MIFFLLMLTAITASAQSTARKFVCGLMDCVEAGEFRTPHTMALLREYVEPLVEAGADTLVLGCTHYPFHPVIEAVFLPAA